MLTVLPVLLTLASPLDGDLPALDLPAQPTPLAMDEFVAELTSSPAWLRVDPTWKNAGGHEAVVFRFGVRQIVRITPKLDSEHGLLPVEGADRVVTVRNGKVARVKVGVPLVVTGTFVLSQQQALTFAAARIAGSVVDAETFGGFARRVYVEQTGGVVAAWRVRVPTLRLEDLQDVWLDAESGEVLRTQPVARLHREVQP